MVVKGVWDKKNAHGLNAYSIAKGIRFPSCQDCQIEVKCPSYLGKLYLFVMVFGGNQKSSGLTDIARDTALRDFLRS